MGIGSAPASTKNSISVTGSSTTGCTNASSPLDESHGCEFCSVSARTHDFATLVNLQLVRTTLVNLQLNA